MSTHPPLPRTLVFSTILLFLFCAGVLQRPGDLCAQQKEKTPSPVVLTGTQLLSLTSSVVAGQEYAIQVSLPQHYSDTTRSFPVVYVLDGQWDFALVQAIYGQQYYDGFVPGLIIVGITWGGAHPNVDSLRARDYTPTHGDQIPQSGQAARFLSFMKQELIPFIDGRFRTSKDRTLMGSSFGGLFTLYAMFEETSLFKRYIAASPAVMWANDGINQFEEEYSQKTPRLPVKLYMVIGQYEYQGAFQSFVKRLKKYEGLQFETKVIENTGHSGNKAEGFTRGLQYVFARPSLSLDPAILKQYVGEYEVAPQMRAKIYIDQGRLMGRAPDGSVQVLHAESEQDFYVKGIFLFLHFKKDKQGKVTGFQLDQYGSTQFVKKVE